MAANRTLIRGRQVPLVPTDGGVLAGDPCVVGQLPGVSLNGKSNAGNTSPQSIDTLGVYNLPVKGIDGSGNAAVASGDILYYTAGDTPPISKKATGVRFGYALGLKRTADANSTGYPSGQVVASGATTSIDVRLGY